MFFVTFVDNVHRVIDLRREEARILCHGRDGLVAKSIDDLLGGMIVETQVVWCYADDGAYEDESNREQLERFEPNTISPMPVVVHPGTSPR